ncbi:MAG: N-acetylmuramoyl-L-alanine amidase [Balneolales bacterium]
MLSSLVRTAGPALITTRIFTLSAVAIILIIAAFCTKPASAQQNISRISSAERSDDLGYVMRIHMAEKADSFKVRQPFVDLIQLQIFKKDIDPDLIRVFESKSPYRGIEFKRISGGIGIDVHLEDDEYFIGNAYPDVNKKDILLALTETAEEKLRPMTDAIQPISWPELAPVEVENAVLSEPPEFSDDDLDDALELYDDFGDFDSESSKFEVVVIDAGHGGRDPGAIGHGGAKEKDVTLAVARKLGNYIKENIPDIEVVYTRDDDSFVGLEERGEMANKAQGDLFISLHANSNHSSQPAGSEVFFLGLHRSEEAFEMMKKENAVIRFEEEEERAEELTREELVIYELANMGNIASSEIIAGMTERQFEERAKRRSRGVKQAGFIVLYHASMPAILVEMGFISNAREQRFLTSEYGQSIIASAIFRAVRDYKGRIDRSQDRNP